VICEQVASEIERHARPPSAQASRTREILRDNEKSADEGRFVHGATLDCRDAEDAERCVEALANHGKPDALVFNCISLSGPI
jgi:NAD(P)-dependent dehydrogenase (short-subunit alcohol dehydrogenase family)